MSVQPGTRFDPPGPGSWVLDATHFTRPATRFVADIFPEQFSRGFGEGLKRYGLLLETLDYRFVAGYPYFCPRPVGAPPDAVGHPPRPVWEQIMASHPEIQARLAAGVQTLAERSWRRDVEWWDREVKPGVIRDQLAIQAVDPSSLDDEALVAHLARCHAHVRHMVYTHHRFNVPAVLPVGDFLAHAQAWTGRPAAELLALMRGASKVSRGAADELDGVRRALAADRGARDRLLSAGDARETLAALRGWPGAVGAAVNAYVEAVGYRVVNGLDVGEPYALELPEVLVEAMRSVAEPATAPSETDGSAAGVAQVRDAVPGAHHQEFDDLLAEARRVYRLRDERAIFCDVWAYGLARRAMLAAGDRLARRGRLERATDFPMADHGEMAALLRGTGGPAADELARRARDREAASWADAPAILGPPPGAPLPAEWLPPGAARLETAVGLCIQAILMTPPPRSEPQRVRGLGASPGLYEGPARLVRTTADLNRIRQGDVLVTATTSAAFNVVLPMLGAIVTDRGGLLSHAAIVARECAIPAVVGCTDATRHIPDGARVRVDGRAGEAVIVQ